MPFQNVLYKYRLAILHVDLAPLSEPGATAADRRRLLRGRELPHACGFNARFAFSQGGFGVAAQLGSVLEGQFLLGPAEQRRLTRDLWTCASTVLSVYRRPAVERQSS